MITKKMFTSVASLVLLFQSGVSHSLEVNSVQRKELLKSALVWSDPGKISQKNLLHGPGTKYQYDQNVKCLFSDSFYINVLGTGKTTKFWCIEKGGDPAKDDIKIKYGEKNGEVFAEVAASRLLWALGFYADKVYPVKVECESCPQEPWSYLNKLFEYKEYEGRNDQHAEEIRNRAAEYILGERKRVESLKTAASKKGEVYAKKFDIAITESKFDGKAIYDQGAIKSTADLNELSVIEEGKGGSTRAQIDALKLLLAFLKHGDSKPENQRFVCPPEHIVKNAAGEIIDCKHAAIVIQDVGATFGNSASSLVITTAVTQGAKASYDDWRKASVWKDAVKCVANLKKNSTGTLNDPEISEDGRRFLADLMVQLDDKQIADMFTAARIDKRGGGKNATVQQWVELFKQKREEILKVTCPN